MLDGSTAVEITKATDSLDIWVDANNNGKRDDDDVNIFVTASGGFYTVSPTFRHALDTTIQARIKELAVALLTQPQTDVSANTTESALRDLALELVVRATSNAMPVAPVMSAPALAAPMAATPSMLAPAPIQSAPQEATYIIPVVRLSQH